MLITVCIILLFLLTTDSFLSTISLLYSTVTRSFAVSHSSKIMLIHFCIHNSFSTSSTLRESSSPCSWSTDSIDLVIRYTTSFFKPRNYPCIMLNIYFKSPLVLSIHFDHHSFAYITYFLIWVITSHRGAQVWFYCSWSNWNCKRSFSFLFSTFPATSGYMASISS